MSRKGGCLLLIGLLSLSHSPARGEPLQPKKDLARTDTFGDPLPSGALARLGTLRFREGSLELLERLGTAEARQLLQALAKGKPEALLTQET